MTRELVEYIFSAATYVYTYSISLISVKLYYKRYMHSLQD